MVSQSLLLLLLLRVGLHVYKHSAVVRCKLKTVPGRPVVSCQDGRACRGLVSQFVRGNNGSIIIVRVFIVKEGKFAGRNAD